jgi:hypothetical protein
VEPIVLGVFILHFVLFVNYKDSEYFLFLRYLIPILLLTIVGYLTLPISGGFKLRNFGGTKLRITTIPRQNPPFPLPGDGYVAAIAKRLGEDRFFSEAFGVFTTYLLFFVYFVWRYSEFSYIC